MAAGVMRARLGLLDSSGVDWEVVSRAAEGLSHAEIVRACEHAAKDAILAHTTALTTAALVRPLSDRQAR